MTWRRPSRSWGRTSRGWDQCRTVKWREWFSFGFSSGEGERRGRKPHRVSGREQRSLSVEVEVSVSVNDLDAVDELSDVDVRDERSGVGVRLPASEEEE